jgi:hypothetical protein
MMHHRIHLILEENPMSMKSLINFRIKISNIDIILDVKLNVMN